jgi:hypothetical protein
MSALRRDWIWADNDVVRKVYHRHGVDYSVVLQWTGQRRRQLEYVLGSRLQHPYFGRKSIKPPFTTPFTRGSEHPWTLAVDIGLSAFALYVTWSAGALNTETLVFEHYLRQVRYHNSLPPSSAFFKP